MIDKRFLITIRDSLSSIRDSLRDSLKLKKKFQKIKMDSLMDSLVMKAQLSIVRC